MPAFTNKLPTETKFELLLTPLAVAICIIHFSSYVDSLDAYLQCIVFATLGFFLSALFRERIHRLAASKHTNENHTRDKFGVRPDTTGYGDETLQPEIAAAVRQAIALKGLNSMGRHLCRRTRARYGFLAA
jgi:hypothetical protein